MTFLIFNPEAILKLISVVLHTHIITKMIGAIIIFHKCILSLSILNYATLLYTVLYMYTYVYEHMTLFVSVFVIHIVCCSYVSSVVLSCHCSSALHAIASLSSY